MHNLELTTDELKAIREALEALDYNRPGLNSALAKVKAELKRTGGVYTLDECRDVLKLGRDKVYELLRSGELTSRRVGRRYLIPAEAGAHAPPHKAADLPALLGVGRSTAYNLLKSGAIRSVRAGRRYLIPAEAVADFLKGAK